MYARAMLAYLPPLFFFAALLGSPVLGFLVFMALGLQHAWQSWRQPASPQAFHWTRQDSWVALNFMSIFLFKVFTLLWSPKPELALGNAAWHLYFLFWPLLLLGLARCQGTQTHIDRGLALGLITTAVISLYLVVVKGDPDVRSLGNVGITAQLTMVLGGWNLLALTRAGTARRDQALYAAALVATGLVLALTTRRLELLGFAVLSFGIVLCRLWHKLTPARLLLLLLLSLALGAAFFALRWEKFAQGIGEIGRYFASRAQGEPYIDSSWGARLEMWRLGITGFLDHPLLGLSASARAYDMPGAPPVDIFGHRHFHSHLLQTLVEGGLLGLAVFAAALWHSTRALIVRAWASQRETALLATSLLAAYALEGAASAALVYDKPNALLVVASAWCWLTVRGSEEHIRKNS